MCGLIVTCLFVLAHTSDETRVRATKIANYCDRRNIKLLFEIHKKVDGIRAIYSGSLVSLADICMKPLGWDCATQNVLQIDFINSMRTARKFSSRISVSLKIEIFLYSVFYMFFEQYLDIWKTSLINFAIAIGAVFIVCLVIICSFWSSAIILLVLAKIVVDLMVVMAILNIQLNVVSVVNLVMAVGIAVKFCVHITHAFLVSSGDRNQRTTEARGTMGASVFRYSSYMLMWVYYFQMYLALVILGYLHGLVFLPVFLSMFGPPSRSVLIEKQDDRPSNASQL